MRNSSLCGAVAGFIVEETPLLRRLRNAAVIPVILLNVAGIAYAEKAVAQAQSPEATAISFVIARHDLAPLGAGLAINPRSSRHGERSTMSMAAIAQLADSLGVRTASLADVLVCTRRGDPVVAPRRVICGFTGGVEVHLAAGEAEQTDAGVLIPVERHDFEQGSGEQGDRVTRKIYHVFLAPTGDESWRVVDVRPG